MTTWTQSDLWSREWPNRRLPVSGGSHAKYVLVRSYSRISKSAWNSVCQRCRRKLNSSCLCASSLSRHRYRLSLPATAKSSPSRLMQAFDQLLQPPPPHRLLLVPSSAAASQDVKLRQQKLTRDQLLIKLGAARTEAGPVAYRIIDIQLPGKDQPVTAETFCFKLNWQKLREARRREGSYLLRSNLTGGDPAKLWAFYLQLVEIEQAFKELKGDLAIRPIYHQTDARIEAHIFVAFLAYCLQVTLKQRLRALAPGLTPRSVLEKMAAIQMVDMHLPTTDGRTVLLSRYTEPELDQLILLRQLKIDLPAQPSPRIASVDVAAP